MSLVMLLMCCCLSNKVVPEELVTDDKTNNNVVYGVVTRLPNRLKQIVPCCNQCCWSWKSRMVHPTNGSHENIGQNGVSETRNNSGDHENGILHRPVLARQNKFNPTQTNGLLVSPIHVKTTGSASSGENEKVSSNEINSEEASVHSIGVSSTIDGNEKEEIDKSPDTSPTLSCHQEEDERNQNVVSEPESVSYPDMTDNVEGDFETVGDLYMSLNSFNLVSLDTGGKVKEIEEEKEPDVEKSQPSQEVMVIPESEMKDKTPPVSPKKSANRIIGKSGLRLKRPIIKEQKPSVLSSIYPDNIPPYEHPKEAVTKCLLQLENPEWEVIMQGLQGVVRLSRHHSTFLMPTLHSIAVTVTKHIRNLRSQVSRAACQASSQLFKSFGRAFEGEVEELAGALFNRTADTNKFLRADCNAALDTMVDNISPVKSIGAIVNRGAKHQNAIVRTSACRLLLKLNERLGPERMLSLPKDTRDALLISSARFLTEGSLDTRRYAKEIFANLAQDNRLPSIMAEVIPTSIMRNISKVLTRLGTK